MESIKEVHLQLLTPTMSPQWQALFTSTTLAIIMSGFWVQKKIFKLLQRRNGRSVNRIILCQQAGFTMIYICILVAILDMYIYPLKALIGQLGCHFLDFLEVYGTLLLQSQSFYTALFRYICVVKECSIFKWNLSPKVLANLIIIGQFASNLWVYVVIRHVAETTPGNGLTLTTCVGQYEKTFESSTFDIYFCQTLTTWTGPWLVCQLAEIWALLTAAINVLDLFFMWKCVQVIKSQTDNVRSFMSVSAFKNRKSEESVMFAVNAWQCIIELFLSFLYAFYMRGLAFFLDNFNPPIEAHKGLRIWLLFNFTVLNSFYLLGDQSFQRHVRKEGLWQALKKALLQDYS